MKTMKAVGVRELKNHLSAYLRDIQRGVRILVKDRDVIIAELREPGERPVDDVHHPVWVSWLERGWIEPPRARRRALPKSPASLPAGVAKSLLDAERGERIP